MSKPQPRTGKEIVSIYIEVPAGFSGSRDENFWINVELIIGLLMRLSNGRVHPIVWKDSEE